MRSLTIFSVIVPLVLCRVPYNVESEMKMEHFKEISELSAVTEEYTKDKKPYQNISQLPLKADDVSFYVYNRENETGEHVLLENAGNITSLSSFRTDLQTIFVIHGWHNDYLSPIDVLIEATLLAFEDVNIIAVCWDDLAQLLYIQSFSAVPFVGNQVGTFITKISESYDYPMSNFAIIGHSLGAHAAGFAGKATNGQIAVIIGLDPAGPLYFSFLRDKRLCEDDAKYVIAIHTCAKLLGVNYQVANADFWPNGGYTQAGCGVDVFGTCSHSRAYQFFVESATSNDFVARQCDSYDNYENGKCKENPKAVMGGSNIDTTITGNYFLNTNASSPYALGDTDL